MSDLMKVQALKQPLSSGFSLIELMLVIAVLTVMSLAGIAAYTQWLQNFQIDKTAQQTEVLLEAVMSYYAHENSWPADNQPLSQYLEPTYLPEGTDFTNPWGQPYTVVSAPTDLYFTLQTTVPSDLLHADQIATMIAAHLPNGQAKANEVLATIPEPATSSIIDSLNELIMSIKFVNSGTIVPKPTCPPNWIPELHYAPLDVETGSFSNMIQVMTCPTTGANSPPPDSTSIDFDCVTTTDTWQPTINVLDTYQNRSGDNGTDPHLQLLEIVSCRNPNPPTYSAAKQVKSTNSPYLF